MYVCNLCTAALSKIRKSDRLNFLEAFEFSVQFWLGIDFYAHSLTTFGWGSSFSAHGHFLYLYVSFFQESTRNCYLTCACEIRLIFSECWSLASSQWEGFQGLGFGLTAGNPCLPKPASGQHSVLRDAYPDPSCIVHRTEVLRTTATPPAEPGLWAGDRSWKWSRRRTAAPCSSPPYTLKP